MTPDRNPAGPDRVSRLAWALARVAGLAAMVVLAGCSRSQAVPEPVRSVRTTTVGAESVTPMVQYAAEIRARAESALGFQVPGRMTLRPAEVGQRVRAGQVLAQIDPQDLRLAQEAANAALRAAETNGVQAQADLKRFEALHAQGFISDAELERRRTTALASDAQVAQARAQAVAQGNQAAYARLLAPADGVVTAVLAEPGTVLAAGAPVLRLAHAGPRDVVFAVPEDAVAAMRGLVGRQGGVEVRLWGEDAWSPASLREVAAAADPVTRAFQVKADLGDAAADLGRTATVRLRGPRADGMLRLPLTALREHGGGSAVWLLDPATMTVNLRAVTVAGADGNDALIAGGLAAGAEVVTAGVHVLTPGQTVVRYQAAVLPAAAPASPTAAAPAAATAPLR